MEISPARSNMNYALDFLKELFGKGLECRTTETHRPVTSPFHDGISNHPIVSALISGIFNEGPPQPKLFTDNT